MPRQVCIFCERAEPFVKITKEHLFSRWVDDILTPELLGQDRTYHAPNAKGNFCFEVTLGYRRLELGR